MKTANQCLSDALLDALVEGELNANEEASVQHHLDSCDDCCSRMRERVGDGQWWKEAESSLAELESSWNPSTLSVGARTQDDRQLTATAIAHLEQWIGPTDDPTKFGRIGSYEVVGLIGVGGAGIVLKAFDARLHRFVAIKTLLPALASSVLARRRFERESRAVAAISHENVVPIYAVDTHNGHPYIAMHYVDGQSLQRRLHEHGPLEPLEIARLGAQIARGLAAAHAQGIIHRDVKPANILLERAVDRALVSDFGLARVVDEATTHSSAVTGTPQYMSPEQCQGVTADQRSDLFSFGSVLYAMCVGRAPFRSDTLMGMLRKVCETTPRDVREINPDIPKWLAGLITRLMQKHPEDRFKSASQVAEILEAEIAHMQSPSTVVAPPREWLPKTDAQPIATPTLRRFVMPAATTLLGAALAVAALQVQTDKPSQGEITINRLDSGQAVIAKAKGYNEAKLEMREVMTFAADSLSEVDIRVDAGNLQFSTHPKDEVSVEVVRKFKIEDETEAKRLAEQHRVEGVVRDAKLVFEAKMDEALKKSKDRHKIYNVNFIFKLPETINLEALTAGGNVSAADLAGNVKLKTAGGNVALKDVQGAVSAETSGGNIKIGNTTGDVKVKTSGGNIDVGEAQGSVEATTSGGNVHVSEVQGTIVATTGGGNVSVQITKQPEADCVISTGAGNIQVGIAKGLKLSLDCKTSLGRIQAPFASSDGKKKQNTHVIHELNGGGPKLVAKTGAGNVALSEHK